MRWIGPPDQVMFAHPTRWRAVTCQEFRPTLKQVKAVAIRRRAKYVQRENPRVTFAVTMLGSRPSLERLEDCRQTISANTGGERLVAHKSGETGQPPGIE